MDRVTRISLVFTLCLTLAGVGSGFAQPAPSVDTLKQVLEQRLQKLKPSPNGERNVLFQEVIPGRANTFKVTGLIRDYDPGYPPNRYYGRTCVNKIDGYVFTLVPGNFGWDVEGRMTPDMANQKCVDNPAAGVSSIPLATLSGTAAPSGPIAASPGVQRAGGVAVGPYECFSNGQSRPLLNFKITGNGTYAGSDGAPGRFALDGASSRITFRGGSIENAFGDGFHTVYHEPGGRPTVSIRSTRGAEAAFCQKVN